MGGGGGPSKSQLRQQEAQFQQQLALERERIELERRARETAAQELGILQEQTQAQQAAYEKQLGILREQQAATTEANKEYKLQLEEQSRLQAEQASRAQGEAARSTNARQQEQRRLAEGILSGAIATSKKRKQRSFITSVTAPGYAPRERDSILAR